MWFRKLVRASREVNFTVYGQVPLDNFHAYEQGATGSKRCARHESGFRSMLLHVRTSYRLNESGPGQLLELPEQANLSSTPYWQALTDHKDGEARGDGFSHAALVGGRGRDRPLRAPRPPVPCAHPVRQPASGVTRPLTLVPKRDNS